MIKSNIFTRKELEVMNKKLANKQLTQVDSNYLSKFIRPKLREIASLNPKMLLDKIEYNQKIEAIEQRIIKKILTNVKKVSAIILYGSAIQTNYKEYNDIDILIAIKDKVYTNLKEKSQKIKELKEKLKQEDIEADIQIYDKKSIEYGSTHNPTLIYELKDCKIIYGDIKLFNGKKEIYTIDLLKKLDLSDVRETYLQSIELYYALRNIIAINLILKHIVDNHKLKVLLNEEIGKNLVEKLRNNTASKEDKKIALIYLTSLLNSTRAEIRGQPWEKIEL